jgi:hypothetical protein
MRVHRIGTKRTAKVATVERGEAGQEVPVTLKVVLRHALRRGVQRALGVQG